jgi:hypothetical protein
MRPGDGLTPGRIADRSPVMAYLRGRVPGGLRSDGIHPAQPGKSGEPAVDAVKRGVVLDGDGREQDIRDVAADNTRHLGQSRKPREGVDVVRNDMGCSAEPSRQAAS